LIYLHVHLLFRELLVLLLLEIGAVLLRKAKEVNRLELKTPATLENR
jgi:hypothetical protein